MKEKYVLYRVCNKMGSWGKNDRDKGVSKVKAVKEKTTGSEII